MRRKLLIVSVLAIGVALTSIVGCKDKVFTVEPFSEKVPEHIEVLSSDEFEGRAPATPGGQKAEEYIKNQFKDIGLKPANGDSYLQAVPLVEITAQGISNLVISGADTELSLGYQKDMMVGTKMLEEAIELENSDIIFVGYGIVAPEYSWNDFEGLDLEGKTVIVLVNDPGFATGDEEFFTGNAMTYYGRWTYKFSEAAKQGAAGAFIIHQTEPASYGWDVVSSSWHGPQYDLAYESGEPRLQAQGWLHLDAAKKVFGMAGVDLDKAIESAAGPNFQPIELNLSASVNFSNNLRVSESHNVIGYIEGSTYPDETFIYMGHWDHLGMVETDEGMQIYNGAVDNATGISGIIEIARKFAEAPKPPERSVVFMALTAEESGLLGSRFYAENPLFPIATTVGGINLDALNVYGPTSDVTVIGYGASELDSYLAKHARAQGRNLTPNRYPERGYYYRSDHFNMAKMGVPMVYAKGGPTYIGKEEGWDELVTDDYENRYHQPSDVVHDLWDYDGIHQDLWLFYSVGKDLANSRDFPNWADGNEFRAIRDETASHRK